MAINSRLFGLVSPTEKKAIEEFLNRLQELYPGRVSRTILFGSKARGDSNPDSDIDILLVVDTEDWRFRHAISDVASDISLEYSVLIGPRVISRQSWGEMKRDRFSLYENVTREGIPLTLEAA